MVSQVLNSRKLLVRALLRLSGETRVGPARDRWLGALCSRPQYQQTKMNKVNSRFLVVAVAVVLGLVPLILSFGITKGIGYAFAAWVIITILKSIVGNIRNYFERRFKSLEEKIEKTKRTEHHQ